MNVTTHSADPAATNPNSGDSWLKVVQGLVESTRFGSVQVLVHDGRVVQIEKLERLRMDKPRE